MRSAKRADTYLFLRMDVNYEDLPQALCDGFGQATEFLQFELHARKKLAQADAVAVMDALQAQGYYLQLPPPKVKPLHPS